MNPHFVGARTNWQMPPDNTSMTLHDSGNKYFFPKNPLNKTKWALPAINYTIPERNDIHNGGLVGVFEMASGLIDSSFSNFEAVTPWLSNLTTSLLCTEDSTFCYKKADLTGYEFMYENWTGLVNKSIGWMFCFGISIIYIISCIFALPVWASKKKCCPTSPTSKIPVIKQFRNLKIDTKRKYLAIGLLFFVVIIFIGDVLVFLTNSWTNKIVKEHIRNDTVVIIDTLEDYVTGIDSQLNYMISEFETIYEKDFTAIDNFGEIFVKPVVERVLASVTPPLNAIETTPKVTEELLKMLHDFDVEVSVVVGQQILFFEKLDSVRKSLEVRSKNCVDLYFDPACSEFYEISTGKNWNELVHDLRRLEPISKPLIRSVNKILELPVIGLVDYTKTLLFELTFDIYKSTTDIRSDIDSQLKQVDKEMNKAFAEIEDATDIFNSVLVFLDSTKDTLQSQLEYVDDMNDIRSNLAVGFAVLVLIITIFYVISATVGILFKSKFKFMENLRDGYEKQIAYSMYVLTVLNSVLALFTQGREALN